MEIIEIDLEHLNDWLLLRHALWPYHTLEDLNEEMLELYKRITKDYIVFLAKDNNKTIGMIELSLKVKSENHDRVNIGYIEGWYVQPDYRQMGIGSTLVKKGEEWAITQNCKEMFSDTNERYPISPIAHKALGYDEIDIPMNYKKDLRKNNIFIK